MKFLAVWSIALTPPIATVAALNIRKPTEFNKWFNDWVDGDISTYYPTVASSKSIVPTVSCVKSTETDQNPKSAMFGCKSIEDLYNKVSSSSGKS